jgi:hypothetical protein
LTPVYWYEPTPEGTELSLVTCPSPPRPYVALKSVDEPSVSVLEVTSSASLSTDVSTSDVPVGSVLVVRFPLASYLKEKVLAS